MKQMKLGAILQLVPQPLFEVGNIHFRNSVEENQDSCRVIFDDAEVNAEEQNGNVFWGGERIAQWIAFLLLDQQPRV